MSVMTEIKSRCDLTAMERHGTIRFIDYMMMSYCGCHTAVAWMHEFAKSENKRLEEERRDYGPSVVKCLLPDTTLKRPENNEARVKHALRRMRDKGAVFDRIPWIEDLERWGNMTEEQKAAIMIAISCVYDGDESIFESPISDELWYKAIDISMFFTERELFLSDSMYGRAVMDHLPHIYFFAVLFGGMSFQSDRTSKDQQAKVMNAVMELSKGMDLDGLMAEIEESDVKLARTENENRCLREQLKRAEKAAASADASSTPLRKEIERLTAEADALREKLADAEERALEEREAAARYGSMLEESGQALYELPEDGIAFVGGHVNLVNKLKLMHPGWRFVSGEYHSTAAFSACDAMFVYSDHMCHVVFENIKRLRDKGMPMLYVHGMNPDMLEQDMRRQWTAFKKRSE